VAKTDFQTHDEYIATFPSNVQAILRTVQQAIRKAVPAADEVISYQIPAFNLDGSWVFYYSAYAKHFSLSCPPPFTAQQAFKDDLARYKQSKSAIQFPLDEPVPAKLIAAMAKHRAREILETVAKKAKPAAKGAARKPAAKK